MPEGQSQQAVAWDKALRDWLARFHASRPAYLIPITVLTGIYLACELSFNARLLDVVGGTPTKPEVDSIEHFGRYISGAALALALWGTAIMPRGVKAKWSIGGWILALGLSAFVSVYMVYNLEGDLIDYLTDHSDGATRQRALYLAALRHGILTGDVQVPTMTLTTGKLATPEGKTFAALFPVLAYSDNDVIRKADKALMTLSAKQFATGPAGVAKAFSAYSGLTVFYGVNLFNGIYAPALDKLHDDIQDNPGSPQLARALFDEKMKPIQAQLGSAAPIPPNLTWQGFFALPGVQAQMRRKLGIPGAAPIPAGLNGRQFQEIVYQPLLDSRVNALMSCYRNPPEAFADHHPEQEAGRRFMRLLLVPPIALAFSLIGALVHITKFSNYALRMAVNKPWLNIRTVGAAVAAIGLSAFLASNAITTSAGFGVLRDETRQQLGPFFVAAFTWVIQAQHYAYPFDEAVRSHVLGGATFGYRPGDRAEPKLVDPCAPEL
ncbi:MAG TPA: hypothetical protein VMH86_16250 [Rhizomicrobium sp.]|nr:hypothetical protein [Rhizomicrobium sp.]